MMVIFLQRISLQKTLMSDIYLSKMCAFILFLIHTCMSSSFREKARTKNRLIMKVGDWIGQQFYRFPGKKHILIIEFFFWTSIHANYG
jgi:hypothetical protein